MHFHLPKPLHGWREFVGEVGIIVIGVLIALGAEQVVEAIHSKEQATKSEAGVNLELAHTAGVFEERTFVEPCLERRLSLLDTILRQARRTGRLPDLGVIGGPPVRPLPSSAWTAAGSDGVAIHFPKERRDALSMLYSQAGPYSTQVEGEREMWSALKLLEHQPGPISPPLLAEISTMFERLRFRSWLNGTNALQLLDAIRILGVRADYAVVTNSPEDRVDRRLLLARTKARPICAPLIVDGQPRT
jgi:hypothetical protein